MTVFKICQYNGTDLLYRKLGEEVSFFSSRGEWKKSGDPARFSKMSEMSEEMTLEEVLAWATRRSEESNRNRAYWRLVLQWLL